MMHMSKICKSATLHRQQKTGFLQPKKSEKTEVQMCEGEFRAHRNLRWPGEE